VASARRTIDHDTIVAWVEEHGGQPAHVKRTGNSSSDPGVLRIDFPGYSGTETLEQLDWDTWFDAFEGNRLAFLYQDTLAIGQPSRFSKLVRRTPDDELADAAPHRRGVRRKGRTRWVNINTASVEELQGLWGVGRITANRIVDYRNQHGRIQSLDELTQIKGIDGGTVANIKRQLESGER